ncbi:MAG: hypothetical protein ACFFED_03390 [Candidatus Thorarchaeota archaeon]
MKQLLSTPNTQSMNRAHWVHRGVIFEDDITYYSNSDNPWPENSFVADDTWHRVEAAQQMSNSTMWAWKDSALMGQITMREVYDSWTINSTTLKSLVFYGNNAYQSWIDDVYIRKWIANEPNHGVWYPNSLSWYHDCSNTTGFVYNEDWNISWVPWNMVGGTLSSDGSVLSISDIPTGTGYHGPVFEYELPNKLRVRDINNLSAIFEVDNSVASYVGYQMVMLGDQNRNPVLFFSFSDGWVDYSQGAYGISYVFENESRTSYGSGYPVTWTYFGGMMNVSYTELGLMVGVEGVGQDILAGLSDADFNREIFYIAIASSRFSSDPLSPMFVDEIYLNYQCISQIESSQPAIDSPEDAEYEAGTTGHDLIWTVAKFTPTSFEVYMEGGLLRSGPWPGGTQLVQDIDNLSPGVYNYTAVVNGAGGIRLVDTVFVTVLDTTEPTLGHPLDIIYEYGTTGHSIIWTSSDIYPDEYTIYIDGSPNPSISWSSGPIVLDIDGLAIDEYNFTIVVTDTSGNWAKDTVIVTVVDTTEPVTSSPENIEYEYGSSGNGISWTLSDLNPDTYSISLDSEIIQTSTWADGTISIDIDGLDIGTYIYTIEVVDDYDNVAIDSVTVTVVDTTNPILNHPPDFEVDISTPSIDITWQPTDLLPFNYEIYQNGTLVSSGTWTSGENLTYVLSADLVPGIYNITVVVWDTSGNYDSDTVYVSLLEVALPFGGDILIISITIGSLVVIVILSSIICRNRAGGAPSSVSDYYYG